MAKSQAPSSKKPFKPDVPNAADFSQTLGQVTWLMTLSKAHRHKPISWVEAHVSAPLMFKQVRVFVRGKQPIAALIWAYVTPDLKVKLESGEDYSMTLEDWRSGPEVVIVDCISPLMDRQMFIDKFMSDVSAAHKKRS